MVAAWTDDERLFALRSAAACKGMAADLSGDLGNPCSVDDARRFWRNLPEFGDGMNRLILEMKYGDPVEW